MATCVGVALSVTPVMVGATLLTVMLAVPVLVGSAVLVAVTVYVPAAVALNS
jgi:hypothetical protein